jgi:small subunit ribosomal protein S8
LVPTSNLKLWVANILKEEGYLEEVERITDRFGTLRLVLKYKANEPTVQHLARISKPGRRVYAPAGQLPRVRSDMGVVIMSTSQGVMTNKEARRRKLGGEVMCEVY